MADINCGKCDEPWDIQYLRWEALWEDPGFFAPKELTEAHHLLMDEDEERFAKAAAEQRRMNPTYTRPEHPDILQKAVLSGQGCPACWTDPSRVRRLGEEAKVAALEQVVMGDTAWDGDPMELF